MRPKVILKTRRIIVKEVIYKVIGSQTIVDKETIIATDLTIGMTTEQIIEELRNNQLKNNHHNLLHRRPSRPVDDDKIETKNKEPKKRKPTEATNCRYK